MDVVEGTINYYIYLLEVAITYQMNLLEEFTKMHDRSYHKFMFFLNICIYE